VGTRKETLLWGYLLGATSVGVGLAASPYVLDNLAQQQTTAQAQRASTLKRQQVVTAQRRDNMAQQLNLNAAQKEQIALVLSN